VSFLVYVAAVIPVQLSSLRSRNLALVEELTWAPGSGFTANVSTKPTASRPASSMSGWS
jgi:hypothetical protein